MSTQVGLGRPGADGPNAPDYFRWCGVYDSTVKYYKYDLIVSSYNGYLYQLQDVSGGPFDPAEDSDPGLIAADRWSNFGPVQSFYAGQWTYGRYYNALDIVLDGNDLYMYNYYTADGTFPITSNEDRWQKITTYDPNVKGLFDVNQRTFGSVFSYTPNTIVLSSDDNFYACITPVILRIDPASSPAYWQPIVPRFRSALYDVYNNFSGGYNNWDIVIWDTDGKLYIKTDDTAFGLYPGEAGSGWSLFCETSAADLLVDEVELGIDDPIGTIKLWADSNKPIDLYYRLTNDNWSAITNLSPKYYGTSSRVTSIYYTVGDIVIAASTIAYKCNVNLTKWSESSLAFTPIVLGLSGEYMSNGIYKLYDCVYEPVNGVFYIDISGTITDINTNTRNSWTPMTELAGGKYAGIYTPAVPYNKNAIVYLGPGLYISNQYAFINYGPPGVGLTNTYWTLITPVFRGTYYSIYNNISGAYENYDVVLYDDGYFYIKVDHTQYGLVPGTSNSGWVRFLNESCYDLPSSSTNILNNIGAFWLDKSNNIQLKYLKYTTSYETVLITNRTPKFYGTFSESSIYNNGDIVLGLGTFIYTISGELVTFPYSITKFTNQRAYDFSGNFVPGNSYVPYNIVYNDGIYYVNITATSNNLTDVTKWTKLSNVRTQFYQGAWDSYNPYVLHDTLFVNGSFFISTVPFYINNYPLTNVNKWASYTPRYCGLHKTDTTYAIYDIVKSGSKYYMNVSGNTTDALNTGSWKVFLNNNIDWNITESYTSGQLVSYAGSINSAALLYVCTGFSTVGVSPNNDPANWDALNVAFGPVYKGQFVGSGADYSAGDIVYKDLSGLCIKGASDFNQITPIFRSALNDILNNSAGGYLVYDIVIWDTGKLYIKTDVNYGLYPGVAGSGWTLFSDSLVGDLVGNYSVTTVGTISLHAVSEAVPIDMYYRVSGNHIKLTNLSPKYYGIGNRIKSIYYTAGDILIQLSTIPARCIVNLSKWPADDYIDTNFDESIPLGLNGENYSNTKTYHLLDCVYDQTSNNYFINISGTITGNPITDKTVWAQMNESGSGKYLGSYTLYKPYSKNSIVYHDNPTVGAAPTGFYIASQSAFINYQPHEEGVGVGLTNDLWKLISPVFRGSYNSLYNDISGGYKNYDVILYSNGYFYIKSDETIIGNAPNDTESGWLQLFKNDYTTYGFNSASSYNTSDIVLDGSPSNIYYATLSNDPGSWSDISNSFVPFANNRSVYYGEWSTHNIYNKGDLVLRPNGSIYECSGNLVVGIEPESGPNSWKLDISGYNWDFCGNWVSGDSYLSKNIVFSNFDYFIDISGANETEPGLNTGWAQMTNNNFELLNETGTYVVYKGEWDSVKPNISGDIVFYKADFYMCLDSKFIVEPGSDDTVWTPINLIFDGIGSNNADFAGGPYSSKIAKTKGGKNSYSVTWWPYYVSDTSGNTYSPSLWLQTDPSGGTAGWLTFQTFGTSAETSWSSSNNYNRGDVVVDMSGNCTLYFSAINGNIGQQPYYNYNTLWIPFPKIGAGIRGVFDTAAIYTQYDIVLYDSEFIMLNQIYSRGPEPNLDPELNLWINVNELLNYVGYRPNIDTNSSTSDYDPYSIVLGKYDFLYISIPGASEFLSLVNNFINPVLYDINDGVIAPGKITVYKYSFLYKNTTLEDISGSDISGATLMPPLGAPFNSSIIFRGEYRDYKGNSVINGYSRFNVVSVGTGLYIKTNSNLSGAPIPVNLILLRLTDSNGWEYFGPLNIFSSFDTYKLHDIVYLGEPPRFYGRVSENFGNGSWAIISGDFMALGYDIVPAPPPEPPMPICLLIGTKVNTPKGWVNIENIAVGDQVYNDSMVPVKIIKTHKWDINWGSKIFGETVYKIPAGLYGADKPVFVSAFHKILINEMDMVEAYQIGLQRALKNEIAPLGVYTLCHIQMEDHHINNFIIEGNCIVESWDGRLTMNSSHTIKITTSNPVPNSVEF